MLRANLKWSLISRSIGWCLVLTLALGMTSCDSVPEQLSQRISATDTPTAASSVNTALNNTDGPLSEVNVPESIVQLAPSLAKFQPQVQILSPKADQILTDDRVTVKLKVTNLPIFRQSELGLGNHLHVILDRETYRGVYDLSQPLVFENLAAGTHSLRVFASRPWHESFKNEGAFDLVTFHVLTKTDANHPDPQQPLLTYSRPAGTYGAEPILLDYYLTNAPSHPGDAGSSVRVPDWRIRATVNNQQFILDRWAPVYLQGFKQGKNWVKLELLDDRGNPIPNVYNDNLSVVTYDPQSKDALAQLIRGEISPDLAQTFVDPNYVASKPISLPPATPTPAPSSTPIPTEATVPTTAPISIPVPIAPSPIASTPPLAKPLPIPTPSVAAPSPAPVPSVADPTPVPAVAQKPIAIASPAPIIFTSPTPTSVAITSPTPAATPQPIEIVPIPTPIAMEPKHLPVATKPVLAPQIAPPPTVTAPTVTAPTVTAPTTTAVVMPIEPPSMVTATKTPPVQPQQTQIDNPVPVTIGKPALPPPAAPSPTPSSNPPAPVATLAPQGNLADRQIPRDRVEPLLQRQPEAPQIAKTDRTPSLPSMPAASNPQPPIATPQIQNPDTPTWQQRSIELLNAAKAKIRAFTNTIPAKSQRFAKNVRIWAGYARDYATEQIQTWRQQHDRVE